MPRPTSSSWSGPRSGDRLRAVVVTDFERLASGVGTSRRCPRARRRQRVPGLPHDRPRPADGAPQPRPRHGKRRSGRPRRSRPSCASASPPNARRRWPRPRASDPPGRRSRRDRRRRSRRRRGGPEVYVVARERLSSRPGRTQVLVGTRALLGEGWDAPSANTLIDLTSVTTATGVQQLRGRILRLDPAWPTKTAHAYDVVCLDQSHRAWRDRVRAPRAPARVGRGGSCRPRGSTPATSCAVSTTSIRRSVRELLRRALEEAGARRGHGRAAPGCASRGERLDLEAGNRRTSDGRSGAGPRSGAVADRGAIRQRDRLVQPPQPPGCRFPDRCAPIGNTLQGAAHPGRRRHRDRAGLRPSSGAQVDGLASRASPWL